MFVLSWRTTHFSSFVKSTEEIATVGSLIVYVGPALIARPTAVILTLLSAPHIIIIIYAYFTLL